eukprot:121639-Chlamydomonas_euryale.AAC.4
MAHPARNSLMPQTGQLSEPCPARPWHANHAQGVHNAAAVDLAASLEPLTQDLLERLTQDRTGWAAPP